MSTLKISLIQTALTWQNPLANRAHFDRLLAPLAGRTDLIILPEMFTTGFTMSSKKLAETMDGPTVKWLRSKAQELGAAITGSLIISENGHYYNRLIWIEPKGRLLHYDKRHLFAYAGEDRHFSPGQEQLTIVYRGWRIRPLICFDLRFPVWSRNYLDADGRAEYDLLLYVANWPASRASDWRALLTARAIENQCYVAAVNRIGTDGNELAYRGNSCLIAPGPERHLCQLAELEATPTLSIDKTSLDNYREKFPFLLKR